MKKILYKRDLTEIKISCHVFNLNCDANAVFDVCERVGAWLAWAAAAGTPPRPPHHLYACRWWVPPAILSPLAFVCLLAALHPTKPSPPSLSLSLSLSLVDLAFIMLGTSKSGSAGRQRLLRRPSTC